MVKSFAKWRQSGSLYHPVTMGCIRLKLVQPWLPEVADMATDGARLTPKWDKSQIF